MAIFAGCCNKKNVADKKRMKNMFFCFHSVVDSFVLKIFAKKAREHLNVIVAEVEKKIFEIVKLEAKQQHDLIFIYAKRT